MTKRKTKTKKSGSLKESYNKYGFLSGVKNNKGKRAPVRLTDTLEGWRASYMKSGRKVPGTKVSRKVKPESLSKRLAKRGHKRVEIWD